LNEEERTPAPLAIIGIGCLFPGAPGFRAFWSQIQGGRDAITDVPATHWRPEDYFHPDPKAPDRVYACRGGFLEPVPFNPAEFGIAPNNLEATDTAQLLGLVVARQTLEDAGYAAEPGAERDGLRPLNRGRVSVILGVTGTLELVIPLGARLGHPIWRRALQEAGVADDVAEDVVRRIGDSYVGWQENSFPGLLGNVVAGRIANRFDLGGTNCVVDAACASSLSALHLAALELQSHRADMVLTGGVDTFNDVFMYMCFSKTPALSPSGEARPFDSTADGTVLGEGVGIVALKRLADATRDGDRIYAVVRGVGTASDGRGNAVYAPKAAGQVEALSAAYRVAGVTPDTVELVEAHGTGTRVGDATEAEALAEVYRATGRPGSWCAVGSVKSQIGHTKAAAGVAGLIKAAAALYHKVLPPSIKVTTPIEPVQPGNSPLYINTQSRPWLASASHPRRAGVSAFGFGGSNFHCVLEEAEASKPGIDWDGDIQILALGADTPEALRARLEECAAAVVEWPSFRTHAAQSRSDWESSRAFRLLLVAQERRTDLAELLANAVAFLQKTPELAAPRPEGIFFGRGASPGKLAALFPGQGAQCIGMFRELACRFPNFQEELAAANGAFQRDHPDDSARLTDRIWPPQEFTPEARAEQESLLRDTATAQPALGAVGMGAFRVLQHFGLRAGAAAGHSYGELTALCAAGWLPASDFYTLSSLRGQLMASQAAGPAGAMLAVGASADATAEVLKEEGIDLVLANKNTPKQTVLSGAAAQVDRAELAFSRRKIATFRLAVAGAFHSPFVGSAAEPFRAALEKVALRPTKVPVFANTNASVYPDDPARARDLLAGQLARPVEWIAQIEAMYAAGVRTFLEIGPGRRLSGMVNTILGGREHAAVALDASERRGSGVFDLACCLAELAAQGHELSLAAWDSPEMRDQPKRANGRPSLLVPLCGANFVKPRRLGTTPLITMNKAESNRHTVANGIAAQKLEGSNRPHQSASAPTPHLRPAAPAPTAGDVATRPTPDSTALAQALQVTRESLAALQKMQEQTAQLQRQFLEGQEAAQRTVQILVEQQQRLLQTSLGWQPSGVAPLPAPPLGPLVEPSPATAVSSPVEQPPSAIPSPARNPAPTRQLSDSAPASIVAGKTHGVLLEVVSEKTGYPPEMLELDMALDADLGIDSIKRVEILSALQERLPDAPAVKPEHLGSLQTLRQVADFLAGAPTQNGHAAFPLANGERKSFDGVLLEVVSEKTGYPPEMLELDMALDADLGIDSIKRVEILSALQERLPDAPTVKPEHLGSLQTLRQVADFLAGAQVELTRYGGPQRPFEEAPKPPGGSALSGAEPTLERSVLRLVPMDHKVRRDAIGLAVDAEVWVASDDPELSKAVAERLEGLGLRARQLTTTELTTTACPPTLGGLVVVASKGPARESFLRDVLGGLRRLSIPLRTAGRQGAAVFLTVSRLDGAFGLVGLDATREPIDGGLAGLAKTASHEWPEVACKALDLAADLSPSDAAAKVVEEMLLAGPTEVGLSALGCSTLKLVVEPVGPTTGSRLFAPGDVIVVSGGARGIMAEVAVALARNFRPTVVLLGRSHPPTTEPDWLAPLTSEADIKRAIGQRANGSSTLRLVGEQYREIVAAREVRRTLARVEAAGGKAVYRSLDVRDGAATAAVLADVRKQFGPIRGLIHGAGVLADARIEDKTDEQFDRVYGTKVQGFRNLLAAVTFEDLRALVVFSSSSGRFGRAGQADYAIANEVLNKLAQQQARRLSGCRVLSVNWGPWDGGMVTPALKRIFEAEGIGLIAPTQGAEFLVTELCSNCRDVEVSVLAPARTPTVPPQATLAPAFERVVELADFPILEDHVLAGRPVVPMVLMVEWLAHGALHHNPGLHFHGFNDFRLFHGVILESKTAPVVNAYAGKAIRRDGLFVAPVELRGRDDHGKHLLHARAEVVLASELPAGPPSGPLPELDAFVASPAEFYGELLFHGPMLQAIEEVQGCGQQGIVGWVRSEPAPARWLRQPLRQKWLADPLVLDASFQLLILWSLSQRAAPNLPCFAGRYRQFSRSFPADGVQVVARVTRAVGMHAFADIDYLNHEGRLIARLEDYECVIDPALKKAFARRHAASAVT
jgi:acyl transferase domain-containing protein